ncbi:unnamed protein product, partial [Mesorhabditis spiculigera]
MALQEQYKFMEPSTSTAEASEDDSRVVFAKNFLFVVNELTQRLEDDSRNAGDPWTLLSWLLQSCRLIARLLNANPALRHELTPKFLADIICANEQLLEFGETGNAKNYERFLADVPLVELAVELTLLSRPRSQFPIPCFFQKAIGARLTSLLIRDDGLSALLTAYNQMANDAMWQNEQLQFQLAKQLALVPRSHKPIVYYEKIARQLFQVLLAGTLPIGRLMALFTDVLMGKGEAGKHAAKVFIFDRLFQFWESLTPESAPRRWDDAADGSVRLLGTWARKKHAAPAAFAEHGMLRLLEVSPTLLGLLDCDLFAPEKPSEAIVKLRKSLLEIITFALASVENQADFLCRYMLRGSPAPFLALSETGGHYVQEQGSARLQLLVAPDPVEHAEEALSKRIRAVTIYIQWLPPAEKTALVVECMAICTKEWTDSRMGEETSLPPGHHQHHRPRFVDFDGAQQGNVATSLSSHMAVGVLFETMGSVDSFDFSDRRVAAAIVSLVQTLLSSTTRLLGYRQIEGEATDEQEDQLMARNVKLAVGLAGGMLLAATFDPELSSLLPLMCEEMEKLSGTVDRIPAVNEAIRRAAEEGRSVADTMRGNGPAASRQSADQRRPAENAEENTEKGELDEFELLRVDLYDDSEAILGQALLRVSRGVRRSYSRYRAAVEEWIYERTVELLYHADSYVYLSAINALAEMAIADTRYLERLVQLQAEWRLPGPEKEADDTRLIMRGRLSEATGKVFRFLGNLGPEWLQRLAPVYIGDLQSEEEITRAGALSAISDMVAACRGRGVETFADQIIHVTPKFLLTEPSPLVRRAFVHLLRDLIRAPSCRMLDLMTGEQLRDVRRCLTRLWKWDGDHVVRLHADLALQEMGANLQEAASADDRPHHHRLLQID